MSEFLVRLAVDGVEVPLVATQRLLQKSPHPGGHRYELVLRSRDLIEQWFRDVESQDSPGSDVQWNVFYGLDRVAGVLGEHSEGGVEYLLNSIDSIRVEVGQLTITGLCSEVVGRAPGGR